MKVWRDAEKFAVEIYSKFAYNKDFGFRDQIQRAAISISNNIAEGFEGYSRKEFIRFLYIAKGSCGEIRSMLYVALDLNYLDKINFENFYRDSISLSKMLSGLIRALEK